MPEESKEGCSRKLDLKTEAQRTNRFNTNFSHNSAFSNLTPCDHLESTNRGNKYRTPEKDDVPCINIILKTVLDPKTEQMDKGIQIVEITAVTESINNRSINSANTSSKEAENVETRCVKVQTEVGKNIRDSGTQTTDELTDQKNIGLRVPKQETPEPDTSKRNKSVQFRDDRVAGNAGGCNRSFSDAGDPNAQSLSNDDCSCDKDAIGTMNIDDFTSTRIADDHRRSTMGLETSVPPVDCCASMETLYKSVNTHGESGRASGLKSQIGKTPAKLSDRIKRNIDELEEVGSCVSKQFSAQTKDTSNGIWQESIRTQSEFLPCSDTCKDFASQAELLRTRSNESDTLLDTSSVLTRDTSTLPSVLSNNPPIPMILIDTTDTVGWESSTRNKSSEVTIGTTVSDSCFPSTLLSIEGTSHKAKNVTMDEDYSDNGRLKACGNIGKKSDLNEKNIEKLSSGTGTRGFWDNENETFLKSGIDKNSTVGRTNTLDGKKTLESTGYLSSTATTDSTELGGTSDLESSRPKARNLLTASDLTRPEFIRMLTELKEHTCSLEMQLFAMNEALKRKQATRSEVISSTLKNYDSPTDHPAQEPRNIMIDTSDEPPSCKSEFSSIEYARLSPEELNVENLSCNSCCAIPDNDSTPENKQLENETGNDGTCSSNISISKRRHKKPGFKTKRSCLWTPLRQSDYRMEKYKLHKLTPTEKSMLDPEVLSPSVSPHPFIVASSSPENCCKQPELFKAESLSPIQKPEKSEVIARSTHSATLNPSSNRMPVRSAALISSTRTKSSGASAGTESSHYESSSNVSSKNLDTQTNDAKPSPPRLKKVGAIPRLKSLSNRNRNRSQTHEGKSENDSACRSAVNNGKDNSDYMFKTEQSTPFSLNNINNRDDLEEEVNSTDYGFNRSTDQCHPKESKDDANGRKRKKGNELTKQDFNSPLNTSDLVRYNCKNNSLTMNSNRNILGKYNQNNSQHEDSKCTIRVTVSLDDTLSNEEVKRI